MVGQSRGKSTMVVNSAVNNDVTDLANIHLKNQILCTKMSTERNN